VAAVLAALPTTWVTFVPCFVFILGAPSVEKLRGNHAVSAALTGVTAAVVGVIGNLAVYFAIHTPVAEMSTKAWGPVTAQVPDFGILRPAALAIALVSAALLFQRGWSVLRTLGSAPPSDY